MAEERTVWDRGKDALEILLRHFPVADLEKLASKVEEKPELVPVFSEMLQQIDSF